MGRHGMVSACWSTLALLVLGATRASANMYLMSNSCPGPTLVSLSDFSNIGVSVSSGVDCAVVVYSGSPNNFLRLTLSSFQSSSVDYFYICDGSTMHSPLLTLMSGSYAPSTLSTST